MLTSAITEVGALGWTNLWIVGFVTASGVLGIAFVYTERRSEQPMMPISIFKNPIFSVAAVIGFVINFAFYGLIFILTLFFQRVQGKTPLETGFAFVPMTAVLVAVNLAAGRFNREFGARKTLVVGLGLAATGCVLLLAAGPSSSVLEMTPAFAVIGTGIAMATPATMASAIDNVHIARAGVGAGVVNAARQIGGAIGVALFGSFISMNSGLFAGMKLTLIVAALALATGAVLAYVIFPSRRASSLTGDAS